ncbi:hypothetical protein PFNF135_05482, partial [Plasmodium falciparum NF135/5.C10]
MHFKINTKFSKNHKTNLIKILLDNDITSFYKHIIS